MEYDRSNISICRAGHARGLRSKLIELAGAEKVASMGDDDVKDWFDEEGFATYLRYTGEYDDSDDILVAETDAVDELVKSGKAFWIHR